MARRRVRNPKMIGSIKTRLKEGKHAGKKVEEVLKLEPSYLLWLFDKGYCNFSFPILEEILKKSKYNR